MRTINWSVLGPVLLQVMLNVTIMTLVMTLFGTAVLKYFVRNVPLLSHAFIFFWAMFRVMVVAAVCIVVATIFDIHAGLFSAVFAILGMGAVGTLIT
jgi:hypothetical protein